MKRLTKIPILLVAVLGIVFCACSRDTLMDPVVEVTTDKQTYNVNDSVEFRFSGYADMITFYSGESGQEYKHRNRVELEGGDLILNIETQVLYGIQADNLKLFMSTDFSGQYNKEGMESATWTDISNRLTFGTANAGGVGVRTISDYASVADLVEAGKPVYFAFRYVGLPSTTGAAQQRTWRIYQFNVQNKFSETEIIPVTDRINAGWTAVTINDPANKGIWFLTNATMTYYNPESNLEDVEKWIVTKRFDPNRVSPDNGVAIKKYPDDDMSIYKYAFSEPGEYEVSFVFVNGNYKGAKEQIKTVKVTVE
ncbi:DUF5017 domain-containing protein [Sphingobacterium alkalisoli]|nr:DUF5017 domain-containing protein [Sphingobacterium alkalisoli]